MFLENLFDIWNDMVGDDEEAVTGGADQLVLLRGERHRACAASLGALAEILRRLLGGSYFPHLIETFVQGTEKALVSGCSNFPFVICHDGSVSRSQGTGRQHDTMIRVRLADLEERRRLATFFTFSNLGVQDDGSGTLLVDFTNFDLDEQAQLRVVNRMLEAWQRTRLHEHHAAIATVD